MADGWVRQAEKLRAELRSAFPDIDSNEATFDVTEKDPETWSDIIRLRRSALRPALFDYQTELAEAVVALTTEEALVALPTGAGKTRTAVAATLGGIARRRFRRVAWLAPSVELVDQALDTFESLWLYQGDVDELVLSRIDTSDIDAPLVLVTTPQAIYARRRENRESQWDLIVFDEAHQLGARTFREAVQILRESGSELQRRDVPLVGLSATPGRVDPRETEDLVSLFGGNLLRSRYLDPNPVKVLQRRGVLARLRFSLMTKSSIPLENEADRIRIAARATADFVSRGRRPLAFTATVPGAVVLAEALRSVGVRAGAAHSGLSRIERKEMIASFAKGDLDVLTNQRLLVTGYDCPAVSDVLILGRIGSAVMFEQIVGRAARGPLTGGSRTATIWDFDDHLSIHGLPQSYYRYRDYDWS
ncbi:MAG: DEAD/DEAH box helicase [Actinomycetota bacterium]